MEQLQPNGMAALQHLASFGRFGATVLHRCQAAALNEVRAEVIRPSGFNQLAASVSCFYSWASGQPGPRVTLQTTAVTPPAPLTYQTPTLKQIRLFLHAQEALVDETKVTDENESKQLDAEPEVKKSDGRLRVNRRRKQKILRGNHQHVSLPCVVTMQGTSLNSNFDFTPYRTSDGVLVECPTKPANTWQPPRDMFLDSATVRQNGAPANSRSSPSGSSTPSSSPLAPTPPSNFPPAASTAEQVASLSLSPPSRATSLACNASRPSSHSPLEKPVTSFGRSPMPVLSPAFSHGLSPSHRPAAGSTFDSPLNSLLNSNSPCNFPSNFPVVSLSSHRPVASSTFDSPLNAFLNSNSPTVSLSSRRLVAGTTFDNPLQPFTPRNSSHHQPAHASKQTHRADPDSTPSSQSGAFRLDRHASSNSDTISQCSSRSHSTLSVRSPVQLLSSAASSPVCAMSPQHPGPQQRVSKSDSEVSTSYDNLLWCPASPQASAACADARDSTDSDPTHVRSGMSTDARSTQAAVLWQSTYSNDLFQDDTGNEAHAQLAGHHAVSPHCHAAIQQSNSSILSSAVPRQPRRHATASDLDRKPCHASLWQGRYSSILDESLFADDDLVPEFSGTNGAAKHNANSLVTPDVIRVTAVSKSITRSSNQATMSRGSKKQRRVVIAQENVHMGSASASHKQQTARPELSDVTNRSQRTCA